MTGFSAKTRGLVRERAMDFNGAFAICEVLAHCQGSRAVAELHHRRGRFMGSTKRPETNTAANALGVCGWCHRWIGDHPADAYKYGWLVRQNETPTDVRVLRRGTWVLLDDLGGIIPVPAPIGGAA